jgi:hypothetical protein
MLPAAAQLYREQIAADLDGDREKTHRARAVLRTTALLAGEIKLVPEGEALYAEFALQPPLMLAATGTKSFKNQRLRTDGSGGPLR